ncbi:MAG: TIGR02147 family protein [Chitinispirillaceae bacterium]|nr:TIGR02147 family protein [Chitinispirillaceae bacterium]
MPNIFNFMDYRSFLLAFYNEEKAKNRGFSYGVMAEKAGFASKSFIKLVIDGKKNLSPNSLQQINRVLKLTGKAFSYFCDLVAFNQAKTTREREAFLHKLFSYRKRNPSRLIVQKQYEFYAKWYHNTVRELVCHGDFSGDYRKLGRMVRPAISAREARASVQLLTRLGFIKKEGKRFVQTSPLITTGDEVMSAAVRKFHEQNMALAVQSMDTCPAPERDISCMVLGLSAAGVERVKAETQAFRKTIMAIAREDKNPDQVYHYNMQFFPTSETRGREP